jgi:hypothetical protein
MGVNGGYFEKTAFQEPRSAGRLADILARREQVEEAIAILEVEATRRRYCHVGDRSASVP